MPSAPFIPAWQDLRPFVAEAWLIAAAVGVLLVPFFVRKPNTAVGAMTLLGLAAGLTGLVIVGPADGGRFAPMLAADGLAYAWKVLLLVFMLGLTLLWWGTTRRQMRQGDATEFLLLLICATLGMSLMASAANLLMVYLAVELASLPSYVLVGFRKSTRPAAEASLKYVLFGAAASAVMVWGLTLLYGVAGTLNFYPQALPDGTVAPGVATQVLAAASAQPMALVGVLAVLVGLAFKIAAVPFHLWCPDVFEGAGVDVTAFLSVASKGAGLILTLRLVLALAGDSAAAATPLPKILAVVLAVMAALTCTIGNTAAYAQNNLKRLLAYSSIAHAGYMLCLVAMLVPGREGGPAFAQLALTLAAPLLFYLAVYVLMNLGAFAVMAGVESTRQGRSGDGGMGDNGPQTGVTLADLAGLGRRMPLAAASLAVCLFSLIGVPPLAGFTAKFNVMQALAAGGGWWWTLVAVIGLNTLLSVYYYFRILAAMYLSPAADEDAAEAPTVDRRPMARATPRVRLATAIAAACGGLLFVLFVAASALSHWTTQHAQVRRTGLNGVRPAELAVVAAGPTPGEICPASVESR